MARLVHWTDLHEEFAPFTIPPFPKEGVDAVLIGGDTNVGMQSLDTIEAIWDAWRVPVLFVLGNHEYYGQETHTLHAQIHARVETARKAGKDITWLHGTARIVAGVRIVGATLWTDMGLITKPEDIVYIGLRMNDYHHIGIMDAPPTHPDAVVPHKTRLLRVTDTVTWHHAQWESIAALVAPPHPGPTVVLTHHVPSPLCIAPQFRGNLLNPAFASDKTNAITGLRVDWWFYGHSHRSVAYDLQRTDGGVCRLRSNCRGYPEEWKHTPFDPNRVYIV